MISTYDNETDVSKASDGFMGTYTGIEFSPLNPDPKTINIYDIAHALSLICRWGGAIKHFHSVAQHCVMVSEICKPEDALNGLLHDASEAYIGDMIRPLKYLTQMYDVYKQIEHRVDNAIAEAFGLDTLEKTTSVEWADTVILCYESINLRNSQSNWPIKGLKKLGDPKINFGVSWDPEIAERKFLDRFYKLSTKVQEGKCNIYG